MTSETVSVAELKAKLSSYLAKARAGETIEVTLRGQPVARITGVPEQAPDGLARLIADGRVAWGGAGKPRGAAIRLEEGDKSVSEIVIDERGPR